jgi:hypothetical protein
VAPIEGDREAVVKTVFWGNPRGGADWRWEKPILLPEDVARAKERLDKIQSFMDGLPKYGRQIVIDSLSSYQESDEEFRARIGTQMRQRLCDEFRVRFDTLHVPPPGQGRILSNLGGPPEEPPAPEPCPQCYTGSLELPCRCK